MVLTPPDRTPPFPDSHRGDPGSAVISRDDRPAVEPAGREIGDQEVRAAADGRYVIRLFVHRGVVTRSHVWAIPNVSG